MARFQQITDPSGNPELEALYQDIVDCGYGTDVPLNWFTTQAIRPDILSATWAVLKGVQVEGRLPATLKQMIAMTVSIQNDCRYCTAAHTGALDSLGVPQHVIESCARNPAEAQIPQLHRDILRFALKAAREPKAVTAEDYEVLRSGGMRDEEILEVAMLAALTTFVNTFADVAAIPVDGER